LRTGAGAAEGPNVTTEEPVQTPDGATETGQIGQNIAAVHDFYVRAEQQLSLSQRQAEWICGVVGRPAFLLSIVVGCSCWVAVNLLAPNLGREAFDPAPFFWLQGLVGLGALLTATVVLIKQNRVAKLSEQRAHLDLKVTLLIEQKTAKVIDLLEELRRDLPNVKDRMDTRAAVMQQAMSPDGVLAALDEPLIMPDGSTAAAPGDPGPKAIDPH
jgi:uncharacterized membrane protein